MFPNLRERQVERINEKTFRWLESNLDLSRDSQARKPFCHARGPSETRVEIFEDLEMANRTYIFTGKRVTIFDVRDKMDAFINNLDVWSSHIKNNVLDSFSQLNSFNETSEVELPWKLRTAIREKLKSSRIQMREYFRHLRASTGWVIN